MSWYEEHVIADPEYSGSPGWVESTFPNFRSYFAATPRELRAFGQVNQLRAWVTSHEGRSPNSASTLDRSKLQPNQRDGDLVSGEFRTRVTQEYVSVRADTLAICGGLSPEEHCLQPCIDSSSVAWHLGHTSWVFEKFALIPHLSNYKVYCTEFDRLFGADSNGNDAGCASAYQRVIGDPSPEAVGDYRRHVDAAMDTLWAELTPKLTNLVTVGIQNERHHQELLASSVRLILSKRTQQTEVLWPQVSLKKQRNRSHLIPIKSGRVSIGHVGEGFCYDNELPRHNVLLPSSFLAANLTRNGEWLNFVQSGGYTRPELWMADGWEIAQREEWRAPLYWRAEADSWSEFGPNGFAPLDLDAPVRNISWFEADACARWMRGRLPTEAELEASEDRLAEYNDNVWQWTSSTYNFYPGHYSAQNPPGVYHDKFMVNRMVLRGGSSATLRPFVRSSYRKFLRPDKRWHFTGMRLARDS